MAERREREPAGSRPLGDGTSGPRLRLGEWLRATRLRRGFSLAEIERDTRINRLYLEALEEEHYDVLPAPVYTRGFLRSYARILGLDPAEAVAMLPADLPRPPGLEPPAALRQPGRDAPALSLPSLPQFGLPALNLAGRSALLRWGAAAAGALLLVAAVWLGARTFGSTGAPTTAAPSQAPGAVSTALAPGAASTARAGGTPAALPVAASDQAPNFIGMQQEVAQRTLQERGVTWVTVGIASNEAPAGEVVGQTPAAGAPLKRGDNITLVVSRGASRN
jgi:cytoskeletal protein RodZ